MSFFRGFITGAAKQYNANVAAQKAEEAEMNRLQTEYGYREDIERKKNQAASLLAQEGFENDMFLKSIEAENDERLERIKGQEDRLTEGLKARLDGSSAMASYVIGTTPDGKPQYAGIPNPRGADGLSRAEDLMGWFDTNGLSLYQQLLEQGDPAQIRDFETKAVSALSMRFAQPDIAIKDPNTGRLTYVDRTAQYPGYMSLVAQSPAIQERISGSLIPDLNRRIKSNAGFPEEFTDIQLTQLESGERAVSVPNPPVWMRDSTGKVDMASYNQVRNIEMNSQIPLDRFFSFITRTGADVESQRAKFETWKKLDNLYAPDPGSPDLTPYLDPTAKAEVARALEPLRLQDPEMALEYFRYMAANDSQPASPTIDPQLRGNQMTAVEMKKLYNRDPEAVRGRAVASRRVVRLADGIMGSVEQGGKVGLAGALQLAAAGVGDTAEALAEVGGEIISVLSATPAMSEADQRVREDQLAFLSDVQGKLARGNSVSETAMIRYYSTLLAYSMAVAVQGGDAAARTVSDQDVQRVASGVAPAAPGSGRVLLSLQELYTVTVAARHEMAEQAVIYGSYGSQDRVLTRAAYYYEQTFQNRPADFRELLKIALSDNPGAYDGLFAGGSPTASATTAPNQRSESFKSRSQSETAAPATTPTPTPAPGPLPGTIN